jgi:RHS repeat-associated protein
MELDADAAVISYEEYLPYGGTAFHAADGATDVSARRYRYTGAERDEETGLYHLGARYYAPWLGRWTSADPAGFVDGPNFYRYTRNQPLGLVDPTGTDPQKKKTPTTTGKQKPSVPAVTFEKKVDETVVRWYQIEGIEIRVAVGVQKAKDLEGKLASIAKTVAKMNKLIPEPSLRVNLVVIADGINRFAKYKGQPILSLDDQGKLDEETVTHEMTHPLFEALRAQVSKGNDSALVIVELFEKLAGTAPMEGLGGIEASAGLLMVDPSQWAPGSEPEHPWKDADEFFASAMAGYQINRKGLEKSIAAAGKHDKAVKQPGKDLLKALEAVAAGKALQGKKGQSFADERKILDIMEFAGNIEDQFDLRRRMKMALEP